jgi:HPt (histidine-containing phosphotransfer) domain-containing protein
MDKPAIERATYDELRETAGDDFVVELVDTFLVEAPRMLDDLRGAYEKRDAEVFRRTAHSLKSNGNTFGARSFAAMAKDLELGGLGPVAEAGGAPIDALAAEFRQVAAALKELRNA